MAVHCPNGTDARGLGARGLTISTYYFGPFDALDDARRVVGFDGGDFLELDPGS